MKNLLGGKGANLAEMNLIGVPVRLTVSPRNLKAGVVELKRRDAEEAEQVPRGEVVEREWRLLASGDIEQSG